MLDQRRGVPLLMRSVSYTFVLFHGDCDRSNLLSNQTITVITLFCKKLNSIIVLRIELRTTQEPIILSKIHIHMLPFPNVF